MRKTKPIPICQFDSCKDKCRMNGHRTPSWDKFCHFHSKKATINRFLTTLYNRMRNRIKGTTTRSPHLYKGLAILPRDVFYNWAKNHPDFLNLYKRYFTSGFDRRLAPSVNRM